MIAAAPAAAPRHVAFRAWEGTEDFSPTGAGTGVDAGRLVIDTPTRTVEHADPPTADPRRYDEATWVSPTWVPGFGAREVIGSWNATTPAGHWIEFAVRATTAAGEQTKWYVLARWCAGDAAVDLRRTSVRDQDDEHARVEADVVVAREGVLFEELQVRLRLYRPAGSDTTPRVSLIGLSASALPDAPTVPVSPGAEAAGTVLEVPAYSQMVHTGHYPEWNGGGEAWCSPTSTAMVLDHFGLGPSAAEVDWVDLEAESRPQVDHAARCVFDRTFGGTGNWAFNTAYAGARGARAYVTRLRSLTEAEAFIAAGVPLICSVSFTRDELDGSGYDTKGHLLTLVGFDPEGNVVVNDPASHERADDAAVRVTYPRAQFENVWVPRTGGLVYVIAPPGRPLPTVPLPDEPNWG